MTTFTDDFNRADGYLGANWVPSGAGWTIASGAAHGAVSNVARLASPTGPGVHDATVTVPNLISTDIQNGPCVKVATDRSNQYYARLTGSSGAYTVQIIRGLSSGQSICTGWAPIVLGGVYTLRLVYNAGNLFAYVNGTLRATGFDTVLDANEYVGMFTASGNSGIDAFTTTTVDTPTFAVSPTSAQAGGPPITLTFYGTGTSWTPGAPGSPTFTVNAGTLSSQTVLSSTLATATFTPPATTQTVIVTDPSTGLTATIYCSTEVGGGGAGGFVPKLTDLGAAIINRAGPTPPVDGVRVFTTQDVVTTSPSAMGVLDSLDFLVRYVWYFAGGAPPGTSGPSLDLLWKVLSNRNEQSTYAWTPTRDTSLKEDLEAALAQFDELRTITGYSLQDVMNIIRGADLRNLTEVYNAISGIGGGSSADVLAAIAAMRGPSEYDLDTIVDHLKAIRTTDLLTLADVRGWIDALPRDWSTHADTLGILAAIAALALTLGAVATAEAEDAAASSAAAAGVVGIVATLAELALQILDILDAVRKLTASADKPLPVPPIWPGEGKVTWGSPVAIEANIPVLGRMHGVVVDLTACEGGTRFFEYDSIRAFSHVGALLFCTDRGDAEPFQAMGPTKAIYCPKQMVEAHACRLYRSRNVRGTITPWLITGV